MSDPAEMLENILNGRPMNASGREGHRRVMKRLFRLGQARPKDPREDTAPAWDTSSPLPHGYYEIAE